MAIVRALLVGLLTPLLTLLLFVTALDIGIVHTVASPTAMKQLLANSGIYNSIVPSALQQLPQIQTNIGSISPSNQLVTQAATAALTPQNVQSDVETILNGVYTWLDGSVQSPNFAVDLSTAKTTFTNNLTSAVRQQLSSLPVCTTSAQVTSFNALSATCLPPGITAASAATQVSNSIVGAQGFLSQPTITANTIKSNNTGQSVFSGQLKHAPAAYQHLKQLPFVLAALTILVAIAIIFLCRTMRRGLRHVGMTLITVGLFLLLCAWILSRVVPVHLLSHINIQSNAVLQQAMRTLSTDLLSAVSRQYVIMGGIYAALGMFAIILSIFVRRHHRPVPVTAESTQVAMPATESSVIAEHTVRHPKSDGIEG